MNQKPLILVPLAALGALGLWLLVSNDDDLAPPGDPTARDERGSETANPAESSTGPDAIDAAADPDAASMVRDAVSTRDALVPIPEDADWIEVRIVEKATGEPLPGANVFWHDQEVDAAVRKDHTLLGKEDVGFWYDPEQIASRFGWQTKSDEHGVARVHQTRSTKVTARHGNLYGHVELGSHLIPPRDGWQLALEPDTSFSVQVLTAPGRPAIGIPIAITWNAPNSTSSNMLYWDAIASTRAPNGLARLPHVQSWRSQLPKDQPFELRARTFLPGIDDPGTQFELEALPTEPLVLHLPACGTIRARVEVSGSEPDVEAFTLREKRSTRNRMFRPATLTGRAESDGWARFAPIVLGKTFTVQASVNGGWISEEFAGPATDGAEVAVVLSPNNRAIMLAGRLLDPDRVPVVNEKFNLQVRGKIRADARVETDAEGRFLAVVGHLRNDNTTDSIAAQLVREGQRPLVGHAAPRELRAGTENLGDIVLGLEPLVAAGRCFADGEPFKLTRPPRMEALQPRKNRDPRWNRLRELTFFSTDDGTFEFRGKPTGDQLRMRVTSSEHMRIDPIEFRLGRDDLEVRLESGARIAATMMMPDETWHTLTAKLTEGQGDSKRELTGGVSGRQDGRHQAQWSNIAAGSYGLTLSILGIDEPIYRVANVAVPPPEGGDPRLIDIDLRGKVTLQTIRLFDNTGKPVNNFRGGVFPTEQDPAGTLRGYPCWGAEAKVLLPSGPTTVMVAVTGYRPAEVQCRGEPVDVRLDPWPKVTLIFPNLPQLPEKTTFQVSLRPPAKDSRRWNAQWQSGSVSDLYAPPTKKTTIAGNKVELPVGDDAHLVEMFVRYSRRSLKVAIPEQHVRMTTPTVTVRFTTEAVQKAIDELHEKK